MCIVALYAELTFLSVFRIVVVTEARFKVVKAHNRLLLHYFQFTRPMCKIAFPFQLTHPVSHKILAQFCFVFLTTKYLLILILYRRFLNQSADERIQPMREITFISFLTETFPEMSAQFRIYFDLFLICQLILIMIRTLM